MLPGEDHVTHTAQEFTSKDFVEHQAYYQARNLDNLTDVMFIGSKVPVRLIEVCIKTMKDAKLLLPDVPKAKLIYFLSAVRSNVEEIDTTSEYFYMTDDSDEEDSNAVKCPSDGRGSGGVGIAAAWGEMTPTNLKDYLDFQGINSPSRLTNLFTRDANGMFEASKRPQTLPLILITRVGDDYTKRNSAGQEEFTMFNGKKLYHRHYWEGHVQSRTMKQSDTPKSHMELGADYCFDMLNSDLIRSEGDALASMPCYNIAGKTICGSYDGAKVFPLTVYNRYISHVTAWMGCKLVMHFKINGFEPVFLFHNILLGKSIHVATQYQLTTISNLNTTHIGLMGFIKGRKGDPSKRMFVSACINGKVPQLLFN